MRRSTLAVLTTVSFAALITAAASASEAVTSPIIMGILKPSDDWKVGTVNVTGASFCAMVNKYDGGVGLAFARSPEGYGTVAMDLRQNVFKADNTYDVQLKTEHGPSRKLQGRATSERSLVVQIGQDAALYNALNSNGTMEIAMPIADVTFSLARFSNSFKNLLNCSDKLPGGSKAASATPVTKGEGPKMAAVKVQDVEQDSLAPIDKEVQGLSNGEKTAAAAPKDAPNSLDAQLDAATNAEVQASKDNVAKLDAQHKEVSDKIEYSRQQVAQIETQKTVVERKLLASTATQTPVIPTAHTGVDAQKWDQEQAAKAAQRAEDQAMLQHAVDTKAAQIATIEDSKANTAQQQVADAGTGEKALDQKAAELATQRDAIAAQQAANTNSKALRAARVAKEAQMADVAAQRTAERDQLTQKLASTQNDFQSKIAALQTERDALKSQLADAKAEAAKWHQADDADRATVKDLQVKLTQSDDIRHTLEARIAQLDAQHKTLASNAEATEKDSKALADARAQLAALKAADDAKVAALEEKLSDKTAQFDALKGQYEALQHQGPAQVSASADPHLAREHLALTSQLSEKQAEIDQLTQKLAKIEADRTAEADKAKMAQADLVSARTEISGIRKSFVVIHDDTMPSREALKAASIQPAAGDNSDLQKAQAEIAALRDKNNALSEQLAVEATKPDAGPGAKALAELAEMHKKNDALAQQLAAAQATPAKSPDLDKAQAELADLRAKNAELDSRLASAEKAAKTPDIASSKTAAELADLRAQNAALQSRLASASQPAATDEKVLAKAQADLADLRAENNALTAKLAETPDVEKAQAELADLRAKNAQLSDKLAAATKPGTNDLDKTHSELADLRAKNEQLSQRLASVANGVPAASTAAVHDNAQLKAEEAELASLRAANADLQQKLASRTNAPSAPVAQAPAASAPAMAKLQPSAGDTTADAAKTANPANWWSAPNSATHHSNVTAATDAQTADAPAADPSYDKNRAAAFLDRIMAYHRPAGGEPAPAPHAVADATPAFGAPITTAEATAPVPHHKQVVHVAAAPVTPAHAVVAHADTGMSSMPDDTDADVAPAPAKTAAKGVVWAPVPKSTAAAPVVAAAAAAPVVRIAAGSPTSLEHLLSTSGVDAKFKPADGNVRQWVSGSVNGMYEQLPAGNFTTQAQAYIDRYRQDCPGGLTVNMSPPQTSSAGTFAKANVSCSQASNSYNTSFVFVQDAKKFSAILHTGYPEDAQKVRSIGDNIAYALGTSGGLSAPTSRKAEAVDPAHHFNIPGGTTPVQSTGAANFGARSDDVLDTVVVQ